MRWRRVVCAAGGRGFPTGENGVRSEPPEPGQGSPCATGQRESRPRSRTGRCSAPPLSGARRPRDRRLRGRRRARLVGVKEAFARRSRPSAALSRRWRGGALGEIPIQIVLGPDLYLFGEETGLEEVIEGARRCRASPAPSCSGCSPNHRTTTPPGEQRRDACQRPAHPRRGRRLAPPSGTDDSPGTWCSPSAATCGARGCSSSRSALLFGTWWRTCGGSTRRKDLQGVLPGASNTVLAPGSWTCRWTSIRCASSDRAWDRRVRRLRRSACMVKAAHLYSRFLYVESCGQCPACKFGTGEVTGSWRRSSRRRFGPGRRIGLGAGEGFDRRAEVRAADRGSLLIQSLVQVFA